MSQNAYWSFKNYEQWKKNKDWEKCSNTSKRQSPIDIRKDKLDSCNAQCRLKLDYNPSKCNVVTHNEVVTIRYDTGSFAYFNDEIYELIEAKIHIPSMHTVDGDHYDMEVDLYHCRAINTEGEKSNKIKEVCSDGGLIIGIFCQSGLEFGKSQDFFNQFINKVPIPETQTNEPIEKSITVSSTWNINNILPKNKSFYTYKGSRPYPPCDENWDWVVFQDYITIGSTNYDTLKYNLSDNYRPIVPLYDRPVYYYNEIDLFKDPVDNKNSDEPEEQGLLDLMESRRRQAWFERNRDFIKSLLYMLVVIALMLLALRCVVVVLKTGMFSEWINGQLVKRQDNYANMGGGPVGNNAGYQQVNNGSAQMNQNYANSNATVNTTNYNPNSGNVNFSVDQTANAGNADYNSNYNSGNVRNEAR